MPVERKMMDRQRIKNMLPGVLLGCYLLAHSLASIAAAAELAVDYFPLHSGNSWIYSENRSTNNTLTVLGGAVNVNGIATKQIRDSYGEISYYTNDTHGLRLHKESDAEGFVTYDPPIKYAHSQLNVGDVISSSGTASLYLPDYGIYSFSVNYTATARVRAIENVTVPLGTFQAVKVVVYVRITGSVLDVPVDLSMVETTWAAKHIGPIKMLSLFEGVTDVYELTAVNIDSDDDGINVTNDNCPLVSNASQLDTDGDGQGNACDLDDDNDATLDSSDNCPLISNANQLDTDGDEQGNACDSDDDNDTVPDSADACPLGAINWVSHNTTDNDRDGCRDNSEDQDDDNDGVNDRLDLFPLNPNESVDADGDGIGDNADTDDDNDGLADIEERRLGTNPNNKDSDNDGLGDGWEVDNDLDPKDGFCPSWVCGGSGGWRHAIQPSMRH